MTDKIYYKKNAAETMNYVLEKEQWTKVEKSSKFDYLGGLMLCYEEQLDGDILDRSNKMKTMQYPTLQVDINHFNCTGLSKIQIYRNGLR